MRTKKPSLLATLRSLLDNGAEFSVIYELLSDCEFFQSQTLELIALALDEDRETRDQDTERIAHIIRARIRAKDSNFFRLLADAVELHATGQTPAKRRLLAILKLVGPEPWRGPMPNHPSEAPAGELIQAPADELILVFHPSLDGWKRRPYVFWHGKIFKDRLNQRPGLTVQQIANAIGQPDAVRQVEREAKILGITLVPASRGRPRKRK